MKRDVLDIISWSALLLAAAMAAKSVVTPAQPQVILPPADPAQAAGGAFNP